MPSLNIQFPFTAVTGQATLKTALLLVAINPAIGGVLISGPRGSAKSTLARSLGELQRHNHSGQKCPFVTLPLGASEEMLLGTLDLQQVLNDQRMAFQPGVFANAHHGILYVDEVNLLADNLVDLLLDVAACGVNYVERDGISHSHEADFMLIGTMNPDEGELRAQLLDRFGLTVELDNHYTIAQRIEIVKCRELFDLNPDAFVNRYQQKQQQLIQTIQRAKKRLNCVVCSDHLREMIAKRCSDAQVDGMRADIVWFRAALAHAALCGRDHMCESDLDAVQSMVLSHRQNAEQSPPPPNTNPTFLPPNFDAKDVDQNSPSSSQQRSKTDPQIPGQWGEMPAQSALSNSAELLPAKKTITSNRKLSVPFTTVLYSRRKGKSVLGNTPTHRVVGTAVDWHNTLIHNPNTWPPSSLLCYPKKTATQVMHLVLLDTSSSTLGHRLISHAKAIALGIAQQAYLAREQLQVMSFRGKKTYCILRAGRAPKQLKPLLDQVQVGGGTPLRLALLHVRKTLLDCLKRSPAALLRTYLITDGRSTANVNGIVLPGESVVIDTENSVIKRGRAQSIAQALGAEYIPFSARG